MASEVVEEEVRAERDRIRQEGECEPVKDVSVFIGTLTSIGLNQRRFRGKEALQAYFLSPLTIPSIVTGIAIYATLTTIGQWAGQKLVPSTLVLILGHVIITIPWAIRLINSGMSGVDRRLEEAALN